MTPDKIKRMLWDLGHFRNPAMPTDVTEADLDSLTLTSEQMRTAIKSYQEFMAADFDRLSQKHHGRQGIPDGEMAEATRELFTVERCGCPDFENDPRVQGATGSGSWPAGCHPDWPDNHAFTISVNNQAPGYLGKVGDPNSVFEKAFQLCRLAYADIGIVFVREDGNRRANTQVTFTRGRGWIGLAIVPNSPRCGDVIWAKFDNRYKPSALIDQWARLLAHEFGHNMSMSHSRGGIMNPSIIGGKFDPNEWRGDPSESKLRRYFGGEPVDLNPDQPDDPDVPPVPDDPDAPNQLVFRGEFTAELDGKKLGTYILSPKPQV